MLTGTFNIYIMLQFVYEVYEEGDKVDYTPTYRVTQNTSEEALDWISREGANHTMFTIKEVIIKSNKLPDFKNT